MRVLVVMALVTGCAELDEEALHPQQPRRVVVVFTEDPAPAVTDSVAKAAETRGMHVPAWDPRKIDPRPYTLYPPPPPFGTCGCE